jgi:iron-sulfur cluster repair protein YtfE (RIC family)
MPLTQTLHDHHKHCDELFAAAEEAAYGKRWQDCRSLFDRFRNELEAHFATEEQILFPAFETTTGMVGGPSQMMRFEHGQMRELLQRMAHALAAQDVAGYAGAGETLLVVMQQHNMKEENILYPMCDRTLAGQTLDLDGKLRERLEAACPV